MRLVEAAIKFAPVATAADLYSARASSRRCRAACAAHLLLRACGLRARSGYMTNGRGSHAVAVAFAREGANVLIAYLSEEDDAQETKRLVEEAGSSAPKPRQLPLQEQHGLGVDWPLCLQGDGRQGLQTSLREQVCATGGQGAMPERA